MHRSLPRLLGPHLAQVDYPLHDAASRGTLFRRTRTFNIGSLLY